MLSAVSPLLFFVPNFFSVTIAQDSKPLKLPEAKKMDIYLALKREQDILLMSVGSSSSIPMAFFYSELNEFA